MKILSVIVLQVLGLGIVFGDEASEAFANGNHEFAVNAFKALAKTENGSLLASPFSAQIALALVAEGAKGTTKSQLVTGISLPKSEALTTQAIRNIVPLLNQSKDDFKLLSANRLFIAEHYPILQSYKKTAVEVYGAGTENVNFGNAANAARIINNFVERRTNNRIQQLVAANQLDASTRLVVVNALYLSAEWVTPFKPQETTKLPFYNAANESRQIDTLHGIVSGRYRRCGYLQAQFLELPFHNSNVTITFVLPFERDGIKRVERDLEEYIKEGDLRQTRVSLYLPKFHTETKIDFKTILESLGVKQIFTDQADLSGISKVERLFIDFVVQKTYINVTETGVEAAAATAVGVGLTGIAIPPFTLRIDHPFLYYIKEKSSNLILFIGKFT